MSVIDPNNDTDFIAKSIAHNLRYPPPNVVPYWGYLTAALKRVPNNGNPSAGHENDLEPPNATDIYWRLYRTLELREYIEFSDDDVVFFRKLALPLAGQAQLHGGLVWLRVGAKLDHVVVNHMEVEANYLQGPITSTAGPPQAGPIHPEGYSPSNVSWTCGGHSFACGGQSFACGGHSFACGGQSFACGGHSFACGGQSFNCG
ncbi:MAG: hypothetical protein WCD37_12000 [Chloroflexia bacterium]